MYYIGIFCYVFVIILQLNMIYYNVYLVKNFSVLKNFTVYTFINCKFYFVQKLNHFVRNRLVYESTKYQQSIMNCQILIHVLVQSLIIKIIFIELNSL